MDARKHLIIIKGKDQPRKGHDKYLLIMNLISNPRVDVSTDQDFQRAYSGYYFPAQVKQSFKDFYFEYMQECRSNKPSFTEILQHIYNHSQLVKNARERISLNPLPVKR